MFELGFEYDRQELLNFVGSKQIQSGIIWGEKEPGCIIVTSGGKHGDSAGYGDMRNPDGTWDYVGQGSVGDQSEDNFANAILIKGRRDVLLFTTREPSLKEQKERGNKRKRYKFEGIFNVLSYNFKIQEASKRSNDRLLVFRLLPVANVYDIGIYTIESHTPINLVELRNEILTSETVIDARKFIGVVDYKARSERIRRYALSRAKGICELCNNQAPFTTIGNYPFLEVHHIHRLADYGPDLPVNVSAICPNCHKEAHFGKKRDEIRFKLVNIVSQKELTIV